MRFRKVGLQPNGAREVRNRVVDPARSHERFSEIFLNLSVGRAEAQRRLEMGDRLRDSARASQGRAKVVVRDIVLVRCYDRMLEQCNTVLPISEIDPGHDEPNRTDDRAKTRERHSRPAPLFEELRHPPGEHDRDPDHR